MAKHSQKDKDKNWTCVQCQDKLCMACVDIIRMTYTDVKICRCKLKGHNTEAFTQQVLDPETNTVHAPGLTVGEDGSVHYHSSECGHLYEESDLSKQIRSLQNGK